MNEDVVLVPSIFTRRETKKKRKTEMETKRRNKYYRISRLIYLYKYIRMKRTHLKTNY